jgi:hypothetical protein
MLKELADWLRSASGSLPEIEKKIMELTTQVTTGVRANQIEVESALKTNAQLIKESIIETGQEIGKASKELNRHFRELAEKTSQQASTTEGKILELAQHLSKSIESNQKEVNKALTANTESIRISVREVGQALDNTSQDFKNKLIGVVTTTNDGIIRITKTLIDAIETNQKQVNDTLTTNTQSMKTTVDGVGRGLGKMNEDFNAYVGTLTKQSAKSIEANQKEVDNALKEHAELIGTSVKAVGQALDHASQDFKNKLIGFVAITSENVTNLTKTLTNAIEDNQRRVDNALTTNSQSIKGSIETTAQNLSKTNEAINNHLTESAKRTKEHVVALDAALTEELTKSLVSLGRQLAALSEKFVKDYSPLTEKLRDVVNIAKGLPHQ